MMGFRASDMEIRKVEAMAERTGLSVTGVFRALINAAVVEPVVAWRPTIRMGGTTTTEEVRNE